MADLSKYKKATTTATTTPSIAPVRNLSKYKKAEVPGFVQSVAQGLANPFLKFGVSAANTASGLFSTGKGLVGAVTGNRDMVTSATNNLNNISANKPVDFGYLGKVRGIGSTGSALGDVKDAAGTAISAASTFVPVSKVKTIGKATLAGRVGQGAYTGAKVGGQTGTLSGLGTGLQQRDSNFGSIALNTLVGGVAGTATGGALGGTTAGLVGGSKLGAKLVTPTGRADMKFDSVASKRLKGIQDLENKNSQVKRIFLDADKRGVDVRKILSETDLLNGAVNTDGRINAQTALQNFDDVVAPYEGKVREQLLKENRILNLDEIMAQAQAYVRNSRLLGKENQAVEREILADIRRQAGQTGTVPVTTLHDLKVQRGQRNNYLDPEANAVNKEVTRFFKDMVEKNTESIDVNGANTELSRLYTIRDAIEVLDNKVLKGGRGGKYFAQTLGGIAGSHLGPVGTVAGAEVAGGIQSQLLRRALGGMQTGKLNVSNNLKSSLTPKPILGLPAPRDNYRSVVESGRAIAMPRISQSSLDALERINPGIKTQIATYLKRGRIPLTQDKIAVTNEIFRRNGDSIRIENNGNIYYPPTLPVIK